eukprot:3603384-Rhodomonas_salina.1
MTLSPGHPVARGAGYLQTRAVWALCSETFRRFGAAGLTVSPPPYALEPLLSLPPPKSQRDEFRAEFTRTHVITRYSGVGTYRGNRDGGVRSHVSSSDDAGLSDDSENSELRAPSVITMSVPDIA